MTDQIILEWIKETCDAYCIPKPFAIVEAIEAARATPADHSRDEWEVIRNATEWLITQPNGRSYTVTDKRKVGIALSCGYDVAAIESQQDPEPQKLADVSNGQWAEIHKDLAEKTLAQVREILTDSTIPHVAVRVCRALERIDLIIPNGAAAIESQRSGDGESS